MKARQLLEKGLCGYPPFAKDSVKDRLKIEDIPVANEFTLVLPGDLLELLLDGEVELSIDLAHTAPILKALNRMAPSNCMN